MVMHAYNPSYLGGLNQAYNPSYLGGESLELGKHRLCSEEGSSHCTQPGQQEQNSVSKKKKKWGVL